MARKRTKPLQTLVCVGLLAYLGVLINPHPPGVMRLTFGPSNELRPSIYRGIVHISVPSNHVGSSPLTIVFGTDFSWAPIFGPDIRLSAGSRWGRRIRESNDAQ